VRRSWLILGAAAILALSGAAAGGPDTRTMDGSRASRPRFEGGISSIRTPPAVYARADTETIRAQMEKILADPYYAPRKTFGQWLREKLLRWDGPHLPKWLTSFLYHAVLLWCILTLLAIFAHLAWTIWLLVRPQQDSPAAALSGGPEDYETASCEQIWERSAELARNGAFRDASGVLLLALLRRLDSLKVLHFHKSKTNGEYVREYPSQRAGRREFGQFIAAFERHIYGGSDVGRPAYDTMTTLAQQVLGNASEKPPV